ncbi:MAG: hypothetical protein WCK16_04095 [Candidatus Moraniibacteriota bacterium]|jgi:hypothetical protein
METLRKNNLFWDIDQEKLDPKKYGIFVAKRILEKGNTDDLDWALQFYGQDFMVDVFQKNSDKFDSKSNNFWYLYFNLNKSECIQKQLTKKQSPFWLR